MHWLPNLSKKQIKYCYFLNILKPKTGKMDPLLRQYKPPRSGEGEGARVSIATILPGNSMLLNKSYQVAQVLVYEIQKEIESIHNTISTMKIR